MFFNERVRCFLGGQPTADEQLALQTKHPQRSVWLRFHARRCTLNVLTPSLVAWAVSMPLIAFHFQQLNPWAVMASILMAPVVFLALLGGFLKIILTAFLPMFAPTWATLAAIPIAWMRHMVDWLAMLPGSDVPLPTNSLLFVAIYYALLFIPFLPVARPRLRSTCRLAPGLAVMMFALIPLTGGANSAPRDGSLRVTLLAVGAGQCSVMEMPDGRVMILDAGSSSLADPVRRCIAPFLRARGHAHVDEIWLSHGDYDHTGAAAELIRAYRVPRLAISTEFDDHAAENPSNETLIATLQERHVAIQQFHRSERVTVGKDVTLDILWPPESAAYNSNNTGLVLKLTYARRTILFPADIQQPALAALLKSPDALRCDVLIAPHHGSAEPATGAFVRAADPLYIVSSNDRTLSQKQRQFDRLVADRSLLRTNRCGAVTIEIDRNGGVTVTPFVPPRP
jgi:competence protein ComEC